VLTSSRRSQVGFVCTLARIIIECELCAGRNERERDHAKEGHVLLQKVLKHDESYQSMDVLLVMYRKLSAGHGGWDRKSG
jgi:hypothetical protein